jgi:hypothetical protein
MVTAHQDFYRKVLLFSRVRELEFGSVRHDNFPRHRWLGQKFIGAFEGNNGCAEIGPNSHKSRRTNLRERDVTEDDSKVLTAKFRLSITSNFKASIMDLLTKLV